MEAQEKMIRRYAAKQQLKARCAKDASRQRIWHFTNHAGPVSPPEGVADNKALDWLQGRTK